MNKYIVYCTEEQTKKALELGAPIEEFFMFYDKEEEPHFVLSEMDNCFKIPTAEQMIGWLETQGAVNFCVDRGYTTRQEATLSAIDRALDYLANKK